MDRGLCRVLKPLPPVIPVKFEELCRAIVDKIMGSQNGYKLSVFSAYSLLEWTHSGINYMLHFRDCGMEGDNVKISYQITTTNSGYTGPVEEYTHTPATINSFDAIFQYFNRCVILGQAARRIYTTPHAPYYY